MRKWIKLASLFHTTAIPPSSAYVISIAIKKALRDGDIRERNRWQILEYWAADYLAGGRLFEGNQHRVKTRKNESR